MYLEQDTLLKRVHSVQEGHGKADRKFSGWFGCKPLSPRPQVRDSWTLPVTMSHLALPDLLTVRGKMLPGKWRCKIWRASLVSSCYCDSGGGAGLPLWREAGRHSSRLPAPGRMSTMSQAVCQRSKCSVGEQLHVPVNGSACGRQETLLLHSHF